MNFPILTSFVLFFLLPLYAFLQRGMEDQKAILLASIIGYFMYFAFTTGLPDAIELYNILKSQDEENRRNAQKMKPQKGEFSSSFLCSKILETYVQNFFDFKKYFLFFLFYLQFYISLIGWSSTSASSQGDQDENIEKRFNFFQIFSIFSSLCMSDKNWKNNLLLWENLWALFFYLFTLGSNKLGVSICICLRWDDDTILDLLIPFVDTYAVLLCMQCCIIKPHLFPPLPQYQSI